MLYKAVIFDLFGTLVDVFSFTEYHRVLHEIGEALGIGAEAAVRGWQKTAWERSTGIIPTIEANLIRICEMEGVPAEPGRIAAASQIRMDFTRRCLVPRADAQETLTRLKAGGRKLGLISDCSPEVPGLWREVPMSSLLDEMLFSPEVALKKPDPKIYLLACERLGVSPGDCLYVGDGDSHELTGAAQAGLHPVRIRVPSERGTDPYRIQGDTWAERTITSLAEVLAIVG